MVKKKVVLIYPYSFDGPPLSFNTPVGLLYVGTYLKEHGYEVKLIDCVVEENYEAKIYREIDDALCVGIYLMSTHIRGLVDILDNIKKKHPNIKIIVGGPHPTLFPKETAEDKSIDFVVKDEGEETMLEIIQALERNQTDFKDIKGITYKSNGNIIDNPARPTINLDKLPFIDWELCNEKVRQCFLIGKLIRVITNRGCPFKCTYCIHVSTMNRRLRYRSPEKVLDEIEYNLDRYKVKRIGLRDEVAFINIGHARELCEGILKRKLKFKWIAMTRVSFFKEGHIDDEFLKLATKAGLERIGIGAESGSQKILDFIQKGITPQQIIHSVKIMKDYGILPMLSFMTGFPGETEDDFSETMLLIKKLHEVIPEYEISGPNLLRPYPGGKLYDFLVSEYNFSNPKTFREWAKQNYASDERLTWLVKSADFYKYLGISLQYARRTTYKEIIADKGYNIHRTLLRLLLKTIWTWRFKHSNYTHPVEYKLYASYYRTFHGSNPFITE